VSVERESIITFPHGIPGFERFKEFGLVAVEEEDPFLRLLSIEEPSLGFVIFNPILVWADYNPDIGKDDLDGLDITRTEDLEVYCVVTLSKVPQEVTVNLKGPICINTQTMKGKQMILVDDRYQTKHSILEATQATR
jgi:flagellar assembly factor FliW